ncbi:SDR family NAD(P)-dependent oxidoreductase [Parahaliea mediterranea]|uniref:SDR family oxidoreductase n=1 Tax=Parahaliea mediterranea TaxID=651086 RepID=A0A939IKQ6_9GAMM|nr:SDR family oxidoreductase [Parahaliea mediterranea]MBN7797581.1 SDR family oxidoreductase [Parahaliea mediterranea]
MPLNQRLHNSAIIVVGAGTGIGAATARRLADEGARVCVADINVPAAQSVVKTLRTAGAEAIAVEVDIADEGSVDAMVAAAVTHFGGLDGAHINAADLKVIHEDSDALAEDLAVFDRTLAVNLRGHLLCTRAVLPHLLRRGGGPIVYTSSGAAEAGEATRPAYAMAKSGLNALMRHVAARWGKEGIRANCVSPGVTLTPEMRASGLLPADFEATMLAHTPHRRLGTPEDIAALVALLLSTDGEWINGQAYHIDGGVIMR